MSASCLFRTEGQSLLQQIFLSITAKPRALWLLLPGSPQPGLFQLFPGVKIDPKLLSTCFYLEIIENHSELKETLFHWILAKISYSDLTK